MDIRIPSHHIANEKEPLSNNLIRKCRAVAAAGSSRRLPRKTVGFLPGQQIFIVPDLLIKCEVQMRELGVGYIPRHLIIKETEDGLSSSIQPTLPGTFDIKVKL